MMIMCNNNVWAHYNTAASTRVYNMSHRDESACGEGNLSSSFRMASMSGTAGSWGDRLASELMNSARTAGRWNGPALNGRGTNIDWSEPAHASPGDSAQHGLAAAGAASWSSSAARPFESADVFGRPVGRPLEVAEHLQYNVIVIIRSYSYIILFRALNSYYLYVRYYIMRRDSRRSWSPACHMFLYL